ncbi:hypothetical protein [Schlesneria sp.]|uniref:hypothetical protein n=1 Tax=Schlesneria sp. TaxID=2762018 RepID=UPI002F10359F
MLQTHREAILDLAKEGQFLPPRDLTSKGILRSYLNRLMAGFSTDLGGESALQPRTSQSSNLLGVSIME